MPAWVRVASLGQGAAAALEGGERGEVWAAFRRAAYLRMGGGLVALTPQGSHAGPIHAVLADPLPPLEVGTAVRVEADRVLVGESLVIDLSAAEAWSGYHPTPGALWRGRRLASRSVAAVAARSALLFPPYRSRCGDWSTALAEPDIARVAGLLGGVGPGLTPSGDDALAGVLFVARLLWGATAEQHLMACLVEARASEPSISFLVWAARGQALAPAHDLLLAAAAGRVDKAARSAALLGQVGASSGADLCLGVQLSLDHLPPARKPPHN
ncbi:MAG: DUF2877 domain-containing protein [Candidatus Dormiibacterota bacterium]